MNWFHIQFRPAIACLLGLALLTVLPVGATNVPNTPPPAWSVNPDDFEFNMNMVIRLEYNSVPNNNAGNIIGAFVGNELRGVATPVFISGDAYYFLTIYSNQYNGETVNFKAYVVQDDQVYGAFEEVTFIHNLSIGFDGTPFWIDINPNADFPPELLPILADTTLVSIPFDPILITDYFLSLDNDPVTWIIQPGANLTATLVNDVLTVTPVSNTWTGTDFVRIIVRENTPNQLSDTIVGLFTVLEDYGAPLWQTIPDQTIFQGQAFSSFDLDNYLTFNGPCRQFDFDVFPFTGTAPDPGWPIISPGSQPMNIIARPLFADIPLAGAGAKLAAFVNGNLAGWATPSGVFPNITYQLVLKNVGAGAITFQFYDAGRQYLYLEVSTLNFSSGGSVGTISAPYQLQLSPLVPSLDQNGVMQIAIDDPNWLGTYPIDFIVWDCDYPDLRRDTFQADFSIISDIRPEITSPTSVNVEENACSELYNTESTDPNNSEGNGLTYSLAGGADAARFAIDNQTGVLSWVSGFSPDFENPQDADTDNRYEVNIRVTNAANLSDILSLTVVITNQQTEPFVVAINGGNTVECTNSTVTLQATGGVSYVWSNGSTQSSIFVGSGTYQVTATSSGACTATASILVAPPPTITASSSNVPVCIGATIQLNSTPGGGTLPYASFSWTGPDSFSSSQEDPAGFPAVPASAGLYTVVVTDQAGCTASAGTTIAVSGNSAPQISATSNSPVCVGANIMLGSTPSGGSGQGYTFVWSGPDNFIAGIQNPQPFLATLAKSGVYTVVLTDNTGCTGVGSTTVQVNAQPVVTAGSNSPVSVGANIILQATAAGGSGTGYTYQWSGPDNFTSMLAAPTPFAAAPASAGTYIVTLTDGQGCSSTASTTVEVVACPTIVAQVANPVCENGLLTLSSVPSGGALPYTSFAWAGPNGYAATVEDPPAFTATLAASGTYTVTVTDQLGCSVTASVFVTVNARSTITAANNGPGCSGFSLALSSTPGAPYSAISWTGPDFFGANVEDPSAFTATVASSGIYQVVMTDLNGCTASATTQVVVYPRPTLTASSNSPLCLDADLNLQSTPASGTPPYVAFNWTGPNGFTAFVEDPTLQDVGLINTGTYYVTVTDQSGCTATASTSVSISSNNAPSITAASNSPVCSGMPLTLTSTPTGGSGVFVGFSWSGPNNYTATVEDPAPFNIFSNGAGVYSVTVTDNRSCKGTATVTVSVSGPAANPTSNSPVCPGGTILLSAGPLLNNTTYQWSGPNNFSSSDREPAGFSAVPGTAGTYFVTITENGCSNVGSVTVVVVDNEPPTITCPANTTIAADPSCSSQLGTYSAVSVSDNCVANPTVTQSPASSTLLNGHNDVETVTLTANDGNGNTQNCSFTVTLKDVTPPQITCPANTTVAADANCNGQVGAYSPASMSDNCSTNLIATQSPEPTTGLSGHNDVETVTLTVNDGNGNMQSCSFTVTLKDVTPPQITCPANTTISADANCNGLLGTYSPVSMSDNCSTNLSAVQSPAAGTLLSGHDDVETVTLTADDGNGNTQNCTFTVTLKDVTAPQITCPANMTVAADANCSGQVGAHSVVSVSDNCTVNPVVTQSPASSTLLSGHDDLETIILTADDGHGNTQSCSFTVTLKDVTAPQITCPANMTVFADANCNGQVGAHSPASVSDNCTVNPTVTQSPAASTGLSGHNDVETVTLTADDGNGNTQSCIFTVTLKDITAPQITCPANMTVSADANCSGQVGAHSAVSVSDNCTVNPAVTQSPAPSTGLSGHNDVETVTLTANDGNGNTQSCTFTVTLKDVTVPQITCPANMTVAADVNCGGQVGSHSAVSVSDNCTVNPAVTQSPVPSTGLSGHNDVETVTLTADDGNGNSQSCTFTVTLKDVTPPTLVCAPYTLPLNTNGMGSIVPSNVLGSGTDNCGTVNLVSVTPNTFSCQNLGANTVTLLANDGNGNSSTCTSVVTVVDNIPPTMACKNATVWLNSSGTASITPADVNNNSTDNCTLASLAVNPFAFICANLGSNIVVLTGTDQSGNTATCQSTVTVLDTIRPTMICQNATLNLNNQGQATLTVADVNNGSFDNCTIVTFQLSQTQFNCSNIGSNTVILRGTDQSGNMGTCTAIVTVRDLVLPTALCKNITANLGANGAVTILPGMVDNGSSDNCTFSLSVTPNTFNCTQIGIQMVTLRATDSSGNSRTCTARVTVRDVTAPTAKCKNVTLALDIVGKATLNPLQIDNGSFDNCSIASRSVSQTLFNCSEIGAAENVFLTVTDPSGNSSTCTALVTVVDNMAPVPYCQNATVTLGSNGSVTVYAAVLADSSYDNCSVWSYSPAAKTYYSSNLGQNNLVITVRDWSNNAATCTSIITVLPNGPQPVEQPVILNREDDIRLAETGLALAVFPNPATDATMVQFDLEKAMDYHLTVYDMAGRVRLLLDQAGEKGQNNLRLDMSTWPSGLYWIKLQAGMAEKIKSVLLQR